MIDGDDELALERKSLDDLVNSLTTKDGLRRELAKIAKAKDKFYEGAGIHYVIESSLRDVTEKYNWKRRKVHPNFALANIRDLSTMHNANMWFVEDSRGCADWIYWLLRGRQKMLTGDSV